MATINIMSVIGQLRPRVKVERTVDLNDLASEISEQSGFDKGDARDFAYKFSSGLIRHLVKGDRVVLDDIGSFKVSCNKDKKLKVNYRPSKSINGALLTQFAGKFSNSSNAGLDDMGFAITWLKANPADTVVMRDGTQITAADIPA